MPSLTRVCASRSSRVCDSRRSTRRLFGWSLRRRLRVDFAMVSAPTATLTVASSSRMRLDETAFCRSDHAIVE
jgi:hypothetical protein